MRTVNEVDQTIDEKERDHRRFLKGVSSVYTLGGYFPTEIILFSKAASISLDWIKQVCSGSILFFMSSYCSACHMEVVEDFIEEFPQFDYGIFYETSEEQFAEHTKPFLGKAHLYPCDLSRLKPQTLVNSVPYALALNKMGQVTGAGVIGTDTEMQQVAYSLLTVYARNNEPK
ncbi:hypothetical protein GMA19_00173 [Paenibacillus polymyxa E681]|uniref:hypothetical protein n=1 Tax=Paenibacillus polymyxa TaxID=1406 RepID=UPI0001E315C0|nr:hypothetical protein [Paenibacillus polymyxa]ADM68057.1 hypothetical protein PPE_00172 [Paenibacillus polymyxa E681]QNV55053.1 hypothetical protein GE561_00173 [Paenibacillus polymyxa E681]QNV59890.1 hypothetical protein GMA19_00173 [Paenibacillus polymyxa E681]